MERSEHHLSDLNTFFAGHPMELALYCAFEQKMEQVFPDCAVEIRKTQISFRHRYLFAAASLPVRRRKGWPAHCLLVTFGLPNRVDAPRITVATEPYPNRWTHHVLISDETQLDGMLFGWLREAYDFAAVKQRRR